MTFSGPPRAATSPGTPPAEQLVSTGWREILYWLIGRRQRIRVSGCSMQPLLEDGDVVLMAPRQRVAEGDIVVARHPFKSGLLLVKYLSEFDASGRARLLGLNPDESTDSRIWGAVAAELVVGKVTSRLPK